MSWFFAAFRFPEPKRYAEAKEKLEAIYKEKAGTLGGMPLGHWRFSSLKDLRTDALNHLAATPSCVVPRGRPGLRFSHDVGDARLMHARNPGAMFQAASQYNCLEFVSPECTPEMGITGYAHDHTQGPACAIACPAATAFRNYLVPMPGVPGGETGQTAHRQLDGLADLGTHLRNHEHAYWDMRNGYADSRPSRLKALNESLKALNACLNEADEAYQSSREYAKSLVRIGTHFHTFATPGKPRDPPVLVGQAFCAATAVAYSRVPYEARELWRPFSELVLESEYEATLWAAILNHYTTADGVTVRTVEAGAERPPCVTVFLTKIGGGVFGNEAEWVAGSLEKAVNRVLEHLTRANAAVTLDLHLVHYKEVEEEYEVWLRGLGEEEEEEEEVEEEEEEEGGAVIEVSPSPSPTEEREEDGEKEKREQDEGGEQAAVVRQGKRRRTSEDGAHELGTEGSSLFLPGEEQARR